MVISGVDAHSYGPFNVNSRTIELSDADTMTVGTPIDSWLDTTEREITLTIEEAGMYQIEMRADEFDAYLELEGPNDYYREDDDSAGELNARIADFLAPGTYQLTARTAYGTDSGLFTLAIEPRDLRLGALAAHTVLEGLADPRVALAHAGEPAPHRPALQLDERLRRTFEDGSSRRVRVSDDPVGIDHDHGAVEVLDDVFVVAL